MSEKIIIVILLIVLIIILIVQRELFDPAVVSKLSVYDNITLQDESNNKFNLYVSDSNLRIDGSGYRLLGSKLQDVNVLYCDRGSTNTNQRLGINVDTPEKCANWCAKNTSGSNIITFNSGNLSNINKCYCKHLGCSPQKVVGLDSYFFI
jgi:hypothetical protein